MIEKIKEKIEKDLDNGEFYQICSNERSFKEYVFSVLYEAYEKGFIDGSDITGRMADEEIKEWRNKGK
jgi:hypothetical protein